MSNSEVAGKNNIEAIYPLSPMQEGMLFHTLYAPESGVYFEQLDCTLHGRLNIPAFRRAWQQVIDRHSVLRTLFVWEHRDKPLQVVRKQVKLPWEQCDWQGLPPSEQQERLESLLRADRARGFDLSEAPLMRLTLVHKAEETYHFIWSFHHLLLDGWSTSLVLKEVFTLYEAGCREEALPLEPSSLYRHYIEWLQQQNMSEAETFWRRMLQGFTAPTPLWVNGARIGGSGTRLTDQEYADQYRRLSPATTAALQSLARQQQVTLNTLVQGAWAILLSRYSGEEDVVFGATVSGRPVELPGVESMIGLFINTLPVRVRVSPQVLLPAWLKELQSQQAEARQYEYSPLTQIQGWSEVPRGQGLFESILVFENYPVGDSVWEQGGSLAVRDVRFFERTNYPLTVAILPGPELGLQVSYDDNHFASLTVDRMLGHLQTLLDGMVANPGARLSDLSLLTESERHQVLVDWNETRADYPQDVCIQQLFEAQVERTPDAVAVVCEGDELTYGELNRRANQLAHYLQSLGVGPETLVGLCVERSLEMVVGLLGVLKSGGAYVPLDPAYPSERLAFMLADTQASVVLTQKRLMASLPSHAAKVVCLDADWPAIAQQSAANPVSRVTADNLAYVIYTSGSTGKPKGAMIQHRSLVSYTETASNAYAIGPGDRILQFASISFDISAEEIYPCLTRGATLVLRTEAMLASPSTFVQNCEDWALTILDLPTAYWHELAAGLSLDELRFPRSLRLVVIGGERALSEQLVVWQKHVDPRIRLVNTYGPTEATVGATIIELSEPIEADTTLREVPIGHAMSNVQLYILDRFLQPVPIGFSGELHIGGTGLARGYLNHPETTAEKFIPNPFSDEPGARLYKSGDLARYRPDGNIEFLGRMDDQVKVRGFRIQLGEIEMTLNQHPAVREAVVLAREDMSGDNRLVAYVVPGVKLPSPNGDSNPVLVRDLRGFLQTRLPKYMVPSAFLLLETLPLTPGGKVDRHTLPAPDATRPALHQAFVAPRNYLELKLVQMWEDILNIRPIGVTDNFFDLGGHSLLVMRLMAQIQKLFGRSLPLSTIFRAATIEHLASVLHQQGDLPPQSPLVAIQPAGSKRPFFCVHPGSGTVLYYVELARHLGPERPFYGLQAPGLDGEQSPCTRIEDLAARYIEALRTVQPQGPYLLGGWCIGGMVAFEMAQQLQRQGHQVALLALIDSDAPIPAAKPPDVDQAALLAWFIMDLGDRFEKDLAISVDELRLLEPDKQLNYALERAKLFDAMPADTELAQFQNILEVYIANLQASRSYLPEIYPGRTALFQAAQPMREAPFGSFRDHKIHWGEFTSWQEFASQPIETCTIPGNHYTMLTEPNVRILAEQLEKCLVQADRFNARLSVVGREVIPSRGQTVTMDLRAK